MLGGLSNAVQTIYMGIQQTQNHDYKEIRKKAIEIGVPCRTPYPESSIIS